MGARRGAADDRGFTLVELMVVVLIIAILIAIAIPTFSGAQDRARDRAAQQAVRVTLSAAKAVAIEQDGYYRTLSVDSGCTPLVAADLTSAEPSLTYEPMPATEPVNNSQTVYFKVSADCSTIWVARESASGTWYGIQSGETSGVRYCKPGFADVDGSTPCTATKW